MLALAEPYLRAIADARKDADFIEILGSLARDFGFHSAFTLEYADDKLTVRRVLDSDSRRADQWGSHLNKGLRQPIDELRTILDRATIQRVDESRFTGPDDPRLAFCQRMDMVELTTVTVSHDNKIVGVAGLCGDVGLDARYQGALQLVVYSLFAQIRGDRRSGIVTAPEPLTPREKEVIALSAEGMTSSEIALRLGLAARTVNQHMDNIADKLGTKNRAHTVAEAVRHRMF